MRKAFEPNRPCALRPGPLHLRVTASPGPRAKGKLLVGNLVICCALGPGGIVTSKREGDGATPRGRFRVESVMVRTDRAPRPFSGLPVRAIRPDDGWCDESGCRLYNRPVRLPLRHGHESMWREDRLYDCVVVIGYNTGLVRPGRGSAIFLHVAAPDYRPTAGCVAIAAADLRRLLPRLDRRTRIHIG